MIPMVDLRPMLAATEPAWRANLDRLFSRMHFILGEQVEAFESELAAALGARFAVAVGTGTSALECSLRAAGLGGSNAEVLVPALTSPFTAQAVLAAGCIPKFSDVNPETLLLDAPLRIGRKTRAVIPVHLYGQACDMHSIRHAGVTVIQDACQAHGAVSGGRPLTRLSAAVALSFYPTKNLPCLGDGGAVLTDSKAVATRLRLLRDGGRRNDQVSRIPALNTRLDEMQACYLRAFLPQLADWNARRRHLASLYDRLFSGCEPVRPVPRNGESVCHLYAVRVARRDALRRYLAGHGIASGVHYPVPLHRQPAFRQWGAPSGTYPAAERACRELVSLPLHPYLEEAAVEEVARRVREFFTR